jgi:hypothetical protein
MSCGIWPCLRVEVRFKAAMCPTTSDPGSFSGLGPVTPHVQRRSAHLSVEVGSGVVRWLELVMLELGPGSTTCLHSIAMRRQSTKPCMEKSVIWPRCSPKANSDTACRAWQGGQRAFTPKVSIT